MRDSKHIRGELTTLLSEQMDVLERKTFGGVTEENGASTRTAVIASVNCTPN